jgi:hypothetical protein
MSNLVVLCSPSYYRFVLLPHYELVSPWASVEYIQTISNDIAWTSFRLVPLLVFRVCHRSVPDLFLCDHKSILLYLFPLVECLFEKKFILEHKIFYRDQMSSRFALVAE